MVTQLRVVDPPLSESVIAKERFALESAIRKVEAEAARKVPLGREPHSAATCPQSIASDGRSVTTGLGPSKQEAAQSDRIAPRATTETAASVQVATFDGQTMLPLPRARFELTVETVKPLA